MPTVEPAPITCTLDPQAMGPRLAEIGQVTRNHLRSHQVDGRTLRLEYDAAGAQEVARIAELERVCCAFLDFELKATANGVALTITAPEQAGTNAQWLFAQFLPPADLPDEPVSKASECACRRC